MTETQTAQVNAEFTYAIDTGEKIVNETMGAGDMSRRRTGVVEEKTMPVRNGRLVRDTLDLETQPQCILPGLKGLAKFTGGVQIQLISI